MTRTPGAAGLVVDVRVRRGDLTIEAAFDAPAGETVALLGPNGAGKSSVLSSIAGLLPPDAGSIELDGEVLDGNGVAVPPERRPIGVVFQHLLLFPHLSAVDNVAFPLRARGVTRAEARERSMALLQRLGVADRAHARPRELSGGEGQRVALARALVAEPRLLLLDEPLSALDVGARSAIRDLLQEELARFAGVRILVTHDPVEGTTLADRLVLLEGGRVSQIGTPEEIRATPRSVYAADLVGVNAFRGRLEPLGDGSGRLMTSSGSVVVPWPAGSSRSAIDPALALLRPSDVTLSLDRPTGSARNVFRGRVTSVAVEGQRARVRIDGSPPLVADITVGSLERLGVRAGQEVWASFKAVEVDVVPM